MITDLDIYCKAQMLVWQHGADATVYVFMRADELLEAGDMEGYAVWRRILDAVDELLARDLASNCSLHYIGRSPPGGNIAGLGKRTV